MIGWSQLDKWYYGVRYANKLPAANDLWHIYFTSSKSVTELRVQHGDPDVIIIDREFETAEEAISYEEQKLKELNVLHESKWLNQHIAGAFGPDCPRGRMFGPDNPQFGISKSGKLNPFYGKKHSESTKKKMSESKRNLWKEKPHPCIGKKASTETRKKMSQIHKGKTLSEKHIAALKEKLSGENNYQFKGYYITPWGKFATLKNASKSCSYEINPYTIKHYCLNSSKVIRKNNKTLSQMFSNYVGKTYSDLGFDFLPMQR